MLDRDRVNVMQMVLLVVQQSKYMCCKKTDTYRVRSSCYFIEVILLRCIQRRVSVLRVQERKKAVKDSQREKRKTKVPKYQKKRRDKLAKVKKH